MKRGLYLFFSICITAVIFYYHKDIVRSITSYRTTTLNPPTTTTRIKTDLSFRNNNTTPSIEPSFNTNTTPPPKKPIKKTSSSQPQEDWGVAKDIGDGTYTIKVGNDPTMGTAQDVLQALNSYRNVNGSQTLTWDDKLGAYAQERAEYMKSIKTTDKHEGFNNFLEHEDGFNKLGFYRVGENSYYGGPLTGVHVIEWVFAKSPGHDANQKDTGWSYVGIGVTDTTVNIIFAANKM